MHPAIAQLYAPSMTDDYFLVVVRQLTLMELHWSEWFHPLQLQSGLNAELHCRLSSVSNHTSNTCWLVLVAVKSWQNPCWGNPLAYLNFSFKDQFLTLKWRDSCLKILQFSQVGGSCKMWGLRWSNAFDVGMLNTSSQTHVTFNPVRKTYDWPQTKRLHASNGTHHNRAQYMFHCRSVISQWNWGFTFNEQGCSKYESTMHNAGLNMMWYQPADVADVGKRTPCQ